MLELIPLTVTLLALAGYGIVLYRLRRCGVRWPVTRVAAVLAGSLCAAAAVLAPPSPATTSCSRCTSPCICCLARCRPRRILLRLLHSFPVAVLAAPATVVVLDLGGLYALYLTGLYQAAEHNCPAGAD
jgi:cytochrome c oxidase assembly factor CtaG